MNVGQSTELQGVHSYFASVELYNSELKIDTDLEALYRKGLLTEYQMDSHKIGETDKTLPYTMIVPTTLGIQLFAIANNELGSWREFPIKDFGDFKDISLPNYSAFSIEKILEDAGLDIKKTEKV